jgi:hypothetical protein
MVSRIFQLILDGEDCSEYGSARFFSVASLNQNSAMKAILPWI